jgi:transposase-like protein
MDKSRGPRRIKLTPKEKMDPQELEDTKVLRKEGFSEAEIKWILKGQRTKELDDEYWQKLVNVRWPNGVKCPHCKSREVKEIKAKRNFQCNSCRKQFSVFFGTIFHRIKISPHQLYEALYYLFKENYPKVRGLERLMKTWGLKRPYSTAHRLYTKLRPLLEQTTHPTIKSLRTLLVIRSDLTNKERTEIQAVIDKYFYEFLTHLFVLI